MNLQKNNILNFGIVLLAVFFGYLSIHPFMTAWVGASTGLYTPIKIWKDILVGVIAIVLLGYGLTNTQLRKKVFNDTAIRLSVAYITLTFAMFILNRSYIDPSGYVGLMFNLRFIALFFIVRVFMYRVAKSNDQVQNSFNFLAKVVIVTASLVALFGIAQVFILPNNFMTHFGYNGFKTISPTSTIDNNINALRAFSTLRGPNEYGAYLIIPTLLCLERLLRTRKWQYGVCALVMTLGLYLSHSRAALIGLVISFVVFGSLWLGRQIDRKIVAYGISITVVLFTVALFAAINYAPARLVVFHSSPGDRSLVAGSTFDHYNASLQGLKDVIKHPLGRGVGQAGPASFYRKDGQKPRIAENYYIQIAQEVGIVGLLLFLSILVVSLRRLLTIKEVAYSKSLFAGFIGLSVVAFFLHTWADDPLSYIAWGLLAVALANSPKSVAETKSRK